MSYNLGSPLKNAFAHAATQGGITALCVGGFSLITGNYSLLLPVVLFSALGAFNTASRYERANEAKKAEAEANRRPSEGPGW